MAGRAGRSILPAWSPSRRSARDIMRPAAETPREIGGVMLECPGIVGPDIGAESRISASADEAAAYRLRGRASAMAVYDFALADISVW